jgi:hypothetical protein
MHTHVVVGMALAVSKGARRCRAQARGRGADRPHLERRLRLARELRHRPPGRGRLSDRRGEGLCQRGSRRHALEHQRGLPGSRRGGDGAAFHGAARERRGYDRAHLACHGHARNWLASGSKHQMPEALAAAASRNTLSRSRIESCSPRPARSTILVAITSLARLSVSGTLRATHTSSRATDIA